MPYISTSQRKLLDDAITAMIDAINDVSWASGNQVAGPLNYVVTRLALGVMPKEPRYANYNEIIGALECCKLELYRHRIGPYEDGKIFLNGDVL